MATLGSKDATRLVKNVDKDAWAGRKSLPTYRSQFLPFRSQGTKLVELEPDGQRCFSLTPGGFATEKWLNAELAHTTAEALGQSIPDIPKSAAPLRLISHFSWKDAGAAEVVGRIISGEYKLCDSQLRRGKKGLMAYLVYSFVPTPRELDPAKVCGVDLGVVIPAVCAVNFGPQRARLGDGGDVWAARSRFRSQRRRSQRRAGLYTKGKNWRRSEKEDNWIHTYYHALTRQVIKFCLEHGCGTIQVEDLSSLRKAEMETEFRRLLWVPAKFQDLLAYKAANAGIKMVKVNPRNTSRRCSSCGHIDKGNRKTQAEFVCLACGEAMNADYNAARNLALAEGDILVKGYLPSGQSEGRDDILGGAA